jgi:uncharacterized repeat protein (TIGR03803 family)
MKCTQLVILWLTCFLISIPTTAATNPESVLYNFQQVYGATPEGGLIFDPYGNIFGTADSGGAAGVGVVFEMTPQAGGWNYQVLYSFQKSGGDGNNPEGSLALDEDDNLYGVTSHGGAYGQGVIYELSPASGEPWAETILYSFGQEAGDGAQPAAGLVFDSIGNLYGTTSAGGITSGSCPSLGCGTVFELSPSFSGVWTETVLYRFQAGSDGYEPLGALVFNSTGSLFGTTADGGGSGCKDNSFLGCGTVFALTPSGTGGWTESVLYAFQGKRDGAGPAAGLAIDVAGNLYGSTVGGGVYGLASCDGDTGGCGVVFELSSTEQGQWSETILHGFRGVKGEYVDGSRPYAGVVFDGIGRLYGTTFRGGSSELGTVFRLTPNENGEWTEEKYAFTQGFYTGQDPYSNVTLDNAGDIFGVTLVGGTAGFGVIFEIVPPN